MAQRILVTGANGFIGCWCIEKLRKLGYSVTGLSRSKQTKQYEYNDITWLYGDILDYEFVQKAMVNIDVVVHLAGITPYLQIVENPSLALNISIRGTSNLIEAFKKNGGKLFIFASSGKVYSPNSGEVLDEKYPTNPVTLAGKIKRQAELLLETHSRQNKNIDFAVMRIFNVYGPNQNKQFLVPKILASLRTGHLSLGDQSVKRDYIHVSDVISAITTIIEHRSFGLSFYNVGSGQAHSIKEIVDLFSKLSGISIDVEKDPLQYRNYESTVECADIQKLQSLGWNPSISIEEGIRNLVLEYLHEYQP